MKYLDESGFVNWSPVAYSWSLTGTQKRQEQTLQRGKRVSLLGVWEPGREMAYGLVVGSIDSQTYIQFINRQAQQAQQKLNRTGAITVIVQDNASIHTSRQVRAQILGWQTQGLYFFQLPKYCSEMNPIEGEWHQLKAHEIRGKMFENTYDLSMEIIAGMRARGDFAGHRVQRFNFQTKRMIRSPWLTA